VNLSPATTALVPFAVVTRISTWPAAWVGAVTVIDVAVLFVTVPAVPPKVTDDALARLVPVRVTAVPVGPLVGLIEVTAGSGAACTFTTTVSATVAFDSRLNV
jgi:hypothetical protein